MKKEVTPAMAAVAVVIAVMLIGGYLYFSNRSTDGHLPTAAEAASGPKVGGKFLPGAAGAGGAASGPNAPANGSSGC